MARELPWPPNLVAVGSVGPGDVLIDTSDESGNVFLYRRARLAIEPFGNIMSMAETPEAVAAILMEKIRADEAKHERELKQKQWESVNPIFRGPPPGP